LSEKRRTGGPFLGIRFAFQVPCGSVPKKRRRRCWAMAKKVCCIKKDQLKKTPNGGLVGFGRAVRRPEKGTRVYLASFRPLTFLRPKVD